MIKKGYCGNESFGLNWDYVVVHQVALFPTTDDLTKDLLEANILKTLKFFE